MEFVIACKTALKHFRREYGDTGFYSIKDIGDPSYSIGKLFFYNLKFFRRIQIIFTGIINYPIL